MMGWIDAELALTAVAVTRQAVVLRPDHGVKVGG